jgi:Xaa-Pro aminopeptidase
VPDQHARRREAVAAELVARQLDAALLTSLVSVRYLSGFTGSAAALLVGADASSVIATDGRYELQAAEECPDLEPLITRAGRRALAERATTAGQNRIGFEDLELTVAAFRELPHSASWQPLGSLVGQLRMVKDATELDALRRACHATDEAFEQVLGRLTPGVPERQVARWIDDALRDLCAGPGFDTIVAAGPNGALPHHQPTARPIAPGELVTMDFGGTFDGYHADMTRTVLVGGAADAWQHEVYEAVRGAQALGVAALSSTAKAADVDAAARDAVVASGYGPQFVHGLGHGVGLQIHEAPYLGASSTDKLVASVPVTVEPGIYLPGRGGVRIEDTVVVHAGRVESLTTSPRELLSVP